MEFLEKAPEGLNPWVVGVEPLLPSGADLRLVQVYLSRPGAFRKTGESQAKRPEATQPCRYRATLPRPSGADSVAAGTYGYDVDSSRSGRFATHHSVAGYASSSRERDFALDPVVQYDALDLTLGKSASAYPHSRLYQSRSRRRTPYTARSSDLAALTVSGSSSQFSQNRTPGSTGAAQD